MDDDQRVARIFGVLFVVTFITSIGALALFQSVLDDPAAYIAGGGKRARSTWSVPGAAADPRERRDRRRPLPDREAAERSSAT